MPVRGTRCWLTACPGGTFPRHQSRGAMQPGKEGGRGSKEATPVQPASQPARGCQAGTGSCAQCQRQWQRQCDPRFPVSVLKVYLTLSVSRPAPRPFLSILSSPKLRQHVHIVSAAVAASNLRSLFANTPRKSSSTPVIRFVFLFSFRILCDPPPPDPSQNPRLLDPAWQHQLAAVPAILNSTRIQGLSISTLHRLVTRQRSRLSPTDHHISVDTTRHSAAPGSDHLWSQISSSHSRPSSPSHT